MEPFDPIHHPDESASERAVGTLPRQAPEAQPPQRTRADQNAGDADRSAQAAVAIPAVSVIMPVYNAERYLAEAIDSVLAQTFRDFELIAIDDGSTDGSLAILREYEATDKRIRVISRPNTGIVRALNDGLAAARAPLIARMDADDICMPDRFQKQVAYLREHPDCVLVGSHVMLMDSTGLPICPRPQTEYGHDQIDKAHLHHGWAVVHPSVMMRQDAVRKIGGYRLQYQWVEDLDLFLRLAEVGKVDNLRDVLLHYRLHPSSVCQTRGELQSRLHLGLFHETRHRRGLPTKQPEEPEKPKPIAEQHRLWAWWALKAGNIPTARRLAMLSVSHAPMRLECWRALFCALRGR